MKKVNKKSRQRTLSGLSLIIIIILIASAVFVYYEYFEEEKIEEEIVEKEIDNRISPLTNQGLVFEVQRIRHRGLYDKLMTRGNAWKNNPNFYFVTNMDGLEYKSKDVAALGAASEILFPTWDTMFQENKIMRDADEEQETSEVSLTIVERVKTGLLKRKTKDIERDKINLKYDYRTGRWTGDDYLKDEDGYGHYRGKTFEVWFNIYQIDYDRDYIPYWTEVNVLGTDPRTNDGLLDPDNDGIPTDWEWKWGYNPNCWDDHLHLDPDLDGIENHEEYKLRKWFADPFSQDVYVEVDYMGKGGFFDPPHILYKESQQALIEVYSRHNIKLYFDDGWPSTPANAGGEVLSHVKTVSQDSGMVLQWYTHHFPDERKGIFRYCIVGHEGNFNHPAKSNVYDTMFISYNFGLKQIILGAINNREMNKRIIRLKVASTLMHEMGHTLGITPWSFEGCDNLTYTHGRAASKEFDRTWGQYWSVMNYYHMYNKNLLDYSDGSNGPPYDQNDWEKIFVASFQYNAELVEEIFFEPPGLDKVIQEETEFGVRGYVLDEALTDQFNKNIKGWSPVDPIEVEWRVYKLEDQEEYPNDRALKIFVRQKTPYTVWLLYSEASLDIEDNIQIYSMADEIEDIMADISQ